MKTIKLNKGYVINEIVITPEIWEKIKKAGDFELYEKLNKYADYEELRIYFSDNKIEMEAHSIKEEKNEI